MENKLHCATATTSPESGMLGFLLDSNNRSVAADIWFYATSNMPGNYVTGDTINYEIGGVLLHCHDVGAATMD